MIAYISIRLILNSEERALLIADIDKGLKK